MARLSIIIPIYNTEAYIAQCLSSIVKNDADKALFEVIIIDDGSTDNSPQIVQTFCEKYPNISYYSQKNQGVSVARMNGVSYAKGEYIWFIDSDDYLIDNSVTTVLELISNNDGIDTFAAPIILHFEDSGDNILHPESFRGGLTTSGPEFLKVGPVSVCPPQFVFRKSLFNNTWLYFPKNVRHEDEYFCRILQYISPSLLSIPYPLYVYRQWPGSFMNSNTIQSLYDMVEVYKQLSCFMEKEAYSKDKDWFRSDIFSFLLGTHSWNSHLFNTQEFIRFRRDQLPFIWREFKKQASHLPMKERILGYILLKAPRAHAFLLSLISLSNPKNG